MTFLIKNITFNKDGATITCPRCQKTGTYQIGQLDRDEWALIKGKYRCRDCRDFYVVPEPIATPIEPEDDINKLLEMI